MKSYPNQFIERNELNLRHGIKSSLAEIKELFALTFALYLANDKKALLNYSKEENLGNEKITISDTLYSKLEVFFGSLITNKLEFRNKINENPLFKAQIEALQVSLELFWKLCKVEFVKSYPSSQERAGGKRFDKKLSFSCNILLLSNVLSENDGNISSKLQSLLYNWIMQTSNFLPDNILVSKIQTTLTIFSEESQFKIRKGDNTELYFQQEGIYAQLVENNTVEDKDSNEPVGAFRILKSFVKSDLHNFIREDGSNGFNIKDNKNIEELNEYLTMVKTSLNLIPKRTVIYQEPISNKVEIKYIKTVPQNLIFFGCPGTGKSHRVTEKVKKAGFTEYKVTFHPEYDYANFVGAYKPYTEADKRITYQFVPQAFIKAYVAAWKNLDKPYCLTIEEINRGNCAAIFGDIFQLLDRDKTGFSQYTIHADTDIANYLKQELAETEYALHIQALYAEREMADCENPYEILCLPPNLSLFATMNTSDQSLFPMDSAFKRRWQWQYVPIDYADAEQFTLKIGEKTYNWSNFLHTINNKIYNITESEDKQMGNRFVNPHEKIIDEEVFVNKVLFYLWFDIFKNEDNRNANYIFKTPDNQLLKYVELFLPDGKPNITKVEQFLEYNKL